MKLIQEKNFFVFRILLILSLAVSRVANTEGDVSLKIFLGRLKRLKVRFKSNGPEGRRNSIHFEFRYKNSTDVTEVIANI